MVAESQMQTILDAFKRPVRHSKLLSCPLCDEWEPPDSLIDQGSPSGHYYRHLARHLQLLALESLPLSIEGLEINLPEEETDVEESEGESDSESLSESSRPVQCPTCHIRWYQDDGGTACHHCRAEGNASPVRDDIFMRFWSFLWATNPVLTFLRRPPDDSRVFSVQLSTSLHPQVSEMKMNPKGFISRMDTRFCG